MSGRHTHGYIEFVTCNASFFFLTILMSSNDDCY